MSWQTPSFKEFKSKPPQSNEWLIKFCKLHNACTTTPKPWQSSASWKVHLAAATTWKVTAEEMNIVKCVERGGVRNHNGARGKEHERAGEQKKELPTTVQSGCMTPNGTELFALTRLTLQDKSIIFPASSVTSSLGLPWNVHHATFQRSFLSTFFRSTWIFLQAPQVAVAFTSNKGITGSS